MKSNKTETASGRKNLWPILLAAVLILFAFAEMSFLSLARFDGFNTKYFDLGAMSQAIWSATEGLPLLFTGQGIPLSRLARNVEFFYFALAPLYAIFPSPQTLLIIQALFYALGGLPLFILARRRLQHQWLAVAITAVYLFYPVAQTAVLAEFHADTLAASFLLFAIEAADRRAWRGYALWLVLALSCKFYVAAPVAAMGVVLWLQGQRRAGALTLMAALFWGLTAFFAVRAMFAPPAAEVALAVNAQSSALGYLSSRFQLDFIGQTAVIRLVHAVIVLMPALLLLGWRAPLWLLPAAVTVIPALLSSDFGPSFSYRTHHYALAAPFLVTAVLFGAVKQLTLAPQVGKRPAWQGRILLTLFMVLAFNLAFIDSPLSPQYYLGRPGQEQGLSDTRFGQTARDPFKAGWLAQNVPGGVPIAADQLSAVRLANRETLYLTRYVDGRPLPELLPELSLVVTDALYDWSLADPFEPERVYEGGVTHEFGVIQTMLSHPEFSLLQAQDGLLLFGRDGPGLRQTVTRLPAQDESVPIASFAEQIGLLNYTVRETSSRRFLLEVDWMLLMPLEHSAPRLAMTRLAGTENMRIVHLPVSVLAPPPSWNPGEVVQESFEILLPEDFAPGTYDLMLGWYDAGHILAAQTDEESRIGSEVYVGTLTLP